MSGDELHLTKKGNATSLNSIKFGIILSANKKHLDLEIQKHSEVLLGILKEEQRKSYDPNEP